MKSVTSGIDELPGDLAVIQTYDKVKAEFPIEGVTATVVVEAEDTTSGAAAEGITAMTDDVKASDAFLPGIESTYSDDGTVAQIDIPTPGNGTDAPSNNALTSSATRSSRRPSAASRVRPSTSGATLPAPPTSPTSSTSGCR